jgi:hypothetical protein
LVAGLPANPSKAFALEQIEETLKSLRLSDTEDRERAAKYSEQVMRMLGIGSSDGLLNRWMYGTVLGTSLSQKQE